MQPYTLLLFRCDRDRLESLNSHLRPYRVTTVTRASDAETELKTVRPDALIAPITSETLQLFTAVAATGNLPMRPLLVLIGESHKTSLPADLVLPARWIDQPLSSALKLRTELLQLQGKLDQEIGNVEAHVEKHKRTAEEIDLLKNAIVRTVSHELKTPLLQIKSAVAMLSDDHEKDWQKLVGYATEATARLETVIKNMTQLANALEIQPAEIQVSDAVSQAERNLHRSWQHKDSVNRVEFSIERRLPLVWADEQAIGIGLQLLIDNALKFSDGKVIVAAHQVETTIEISVTDRGIGIPVDKFDKIFDPFYQVDNSDARRFGGIGVGLAIVRLILERHHVPITVTSELGKGSTFSFALPCVN
jgi:signal transduction histidine kinase